MTTSSLVPPTREALRRRHGRLAGLLFIASAAVSVPSTLLLEPAPARASYLVTFAVVLTGTAFWFAPWSRMGDAWLHVATFTGTVGVTASLIVFSPDYRVIYFVVLAYAAYVFDTRRAVAVHAALAAGGLALALGVTQHGHAAVATILAFVPALFLVTALIAYLNEQLAASRDAYRSFAGETIDLALRIRTSAGSALNGAAVARREEAELDELAQAADALHLRPVGAYDSPPTPPSPAPAEPASARPGVPRARPRTPVARPIAGQPPRP